MARCARSLPRLERQGQPGKASKKGRGAGTRRISVEAMGGGGGGGVLDQARIKLPKLWYGRLN